MEEILDTSAPVSKPQAKGGIARKQKLSPEERTAIAQRAAKARWTGRRKRGKAAAVAAVRVQSRSGARSQNGIFGRALAAAEERLAQAIQERARAASTWAVLNAEIPSLQSTIAALRNQQNPGAASAQTQLLPDGSFPVTSGSPDTMGYTLAQVVSDAPVPASTTPRALAASRVGGGAVGIDLAAPADDEDQFLTDNVNGGGQWH